MADTKNIIQNGKCLSIKKFNLSEIKRYLYPSIAIIGKHDSGKSVLVRDIMKHYNDVPGGIIISGNKENQKFYQKFYPDLFIYHKYDPEILSNLLLRQEKLIELKRKKEENNINTESFLVMDDCLNIGGRWNKDEQILEVFMNGRHHGLFFILTMQYPLGIGPEFRVNFDFIFIFSENFINVQKKIYEHYCGMFPTFQSFKIVFKELTNQTIVRELTKKDKCIVINNRIRSENIEDIVKWYEVSLDDIDNSENKYIGSNSFVEYHNNNYHKINSPKEIEDKTLRLDKIKSDEIKINIPDLIESNNDLDEIDVSNLIWNVFNDQDEIKIKSPKSIKSNDDRDEIKVVDKTIKEILGENKVLKIKEFNISNLNGTYPSSILMIGKRGTMIKPAIKEILDTNKNIKGSIVSPTEKDNPYFVNNAKHMDIFEGYNDHIVTSLMEHQKESKYQSKVALVLNDCMTNNHVIKNKAFTELIQNSNNYNIMFIHTIAYPASITPELRSEFNYVFIFKDDYVSNKKKLYNHYGDMFSSFKEFERVFNMCTNHEFGDCMVIKQNGYSNNVEDRVFWHKINS